MSENKTKAKNLQRMTAYIKGHKISSAILLLCILAFIVVHNDVLCTGAVYFLKRFILHTPTDELGPMIYNCRHAGDIVLMLCACAIVFLLWMKRAELFFIAYIAVVFIENNVYIWTGTSYGGYLYRWGYEDFTDPIKSGYGALYGTNYPPLAVLVFKFFHILTDVEGEQRYVLNYALFLYIAATMLAVFVLIFQLMTKGRLFSHRTALLMSAAVFMTGSMLSAYERMNIVFLAFIFTLLFFLLYDAGGAFERQLGLLALALAFNIKFYPAIYGLLLLKKKRFRDAFIAAAEGLLLFFIPMVFQAIGSVQAAVGTASVLRMTASAGSGGILLQYTERDPAGIEKLIQSITKFSEKNMSAPGISINNIVTRVMNALGEQDPGVIGFYARIVMIAFIVITLLAFAVSVREYNDALLLSFLCVFVPGVSFWYTTIFLIPPLILLLRSMKEEGFGLWECAELLFFAIILSYVNNSLLKMGPRSGLWMILLWFLVCVRAAWEFSRSLREKKDAGSVKGDAE